MSQLPNILILSGLRIFPEQSGGHLRSGSFAKALARMGHQVRVESLAGRNQDYLCRQKRLDFQIEANLEERVHLSLGFGLCQALARRLHLPRLWQYPILQAGLIPDSLRESLHWAEVIVCDLPYVPIIKGSWRNKPWLLLSHNLEFQLLHQGSYLDRRVFAPIVQGLERNAFQRFDGILACAKEDFQYFTRHNPSAKPLQLLPNGIDAALYTPDPEQKRRMRQQMAVQADEKLILFSGSHYAPNTEALELLEQFTVEEEAFLHDQKIKFLIVGSMGRAKKNSLMISTGFVSSVLPYFQAADFALNPVERGSGSNVKIFEYLAARLPILSTEFGVRGTDLQPGLDYTPYAGKQLREGLQNLLSAHDSIQWQTKAEAIWQRQANRCDMTALVKVEWQQLYQQLSQKYLGRTPTRSGARPQLRLVK